MDKDRKKELQDEYKRKELEKLSQSDSKVMAAFARNKLGTKTESLSRQRLEQIANHLLIAAIVEKINEVSENRYRSNPSKYKSAGNVVSQLNASLRAIYFTTDFLMQVALGDTEKHFASATPAELTELANAFQILGLEGIAQKIVLRLAPDVQKQLSNQEEIDKVRVQYIRKHLSDFELE